MQVIDIDEEGRCLAITATGKEERSLTIPENAMGKSVSLMCSFMNECMAPDAFLNGENIISKVPCSVVVYVLARSIVLIVFHGVQQGSLHSLVCEGCLQVPVTTYTSF